MRELLSVFLFIFFALPQVSAQLQIPVLEQSSVLTSSTLELLVPQKAAPLDLAQAMLGPNAGMQSQGAAISSRSLLYRPHLAFFCRVEVELEQAAKMPIRFRLGSVDYVDYLEGKRSQ